MALAEKLSIPVATSVNGKGTILYGHPLSVGVVGSYSARCANQVVSEADLVIYVSDNQSWVDARSAGSTETMRQWGAFKERNPKAKLVCIDVQPFANTQAKEREDVLNVGGFSDEVFEVVNAFADGTLHGGHWVERIEKIEV